MEQLISEHTAARPAFTCARAVVSRMAPVLQSAVQQSYDSIDAPNTTHQDMLSLLHNLVLSALVVHTHL
jgi:hypothetical protein